MSSHQLKIVALWPPLVLGEERGSFQEFEDRIEASVVALEWNCADTEVVRVFCITLDWAYFKVSFISLARVVSELTVDG